MAQMTRISVCLRMIQGPRGYWEKSVPGKQHSNLQDLGKLRESSFYTGSRSIVVIGLDADLPTSMVPHKNHP